MLNKAELTRILMDAKSDRTGLGDDVRTLVNYIKDLNIPECNCLGGPFTHLKGVRGCRENHIPFDRLGETKKLLSRATKIIDDLGKELGILPAQEPNENKGQTKPRTHLWVSKSGHDTWEHPTDSICVTCKVNGNDKEANEPCHGQKDEMNQASVTCNGSPGHPGSRPLSGGYVSFYRCNGCSVCRKVTHEHQ